MSDEGSTAIKITIILIVVTILALVPVMYWANKSGAEMRGKLTSEVPAQITGVSFKQGFKNHRDETTVRYRYVVGGRVYDKEKMNLGDYRSKFSVRSPAKVCYDPELPENSQVREMSYRCGT